MKLKRLAIPTAIAGILALPAQSAFANSVSPDELDKTPVQDITASTLDTLEATGDQDLTELAQFLLDEFEEYVPAATAVSWVDLSLDLVVDKFGPTPNDDLVAFLARERTDWIDRNGSNPSNPSSGSNLNTSPVPLPAALWLFGSGLIGLGSLSTKKYRNAG